MPLIDPNDRAEVSGYDRAAASRILAEIAAPGVFPSPVTVELPDAARHLTYRLEPLEPAPGSRLTPSQLDYLGRFMAPCTEAEVSTATHRVSWTDSAGVPNIGWCIPAPDGLGPVVPIVAREATLVLWRQLAADPRDLEHAAERLTPDQHRCLAATTTDIDPHEIFRIAVEAASRALVQHALLAGTTSHRTPAGFARAMAASQIYALVGSTWYWELQASTARRGMVPVAFDERPGGRLAYTPSSIELLAAMKANTIATARRVMHQATTTEGLTVREAVARYYLELDEISKQYALLPEGESPRCLGLIVHELPAGPFSALPGLVAAFTDVFCELLDQIGAAPAEGEASRPITDVRERTFHIPDMNCQHCKATITGVLEGLGIEVADVDLVTKRVVAQFADSGQRERAFDAIRSGGYTVVPPEAAAGGT